MGDMEMNELSPNDASRFSQLEQIISPDMVEWALQKTYEFARLMSYYKCAMMEIETKLNVLNEEFSLRFDRQPISIHNKLVAKGLPITVESIEKGLNDIAGIRVICSFEDDVYKLAEALLKQDDISLIQRKDYIQNPKPNDYRSLHLIVAVPIFLEHEKRIMRAEVQLRTIAMDSWASLEHQLRYKKGNSFDENMSDELKRCAELSVELDARMDHLRSIIYTDASNGKSPDVLSESESHRIPAEEDTREAGEEKEKQADLVYKQKHGDRVHCASGSDRADSSAVDLASGL